MIDESALRQRVGELLEGLYAKRFAALDALTLSTLLAKNPYLYRALGEDVPENLLRQMLAARVSSSDETIFGNDFFEPLAVFAAREARGGIGVTVGAGAGQDIAIETANEYLAISVKSGTNIFNAQSEKGQSAEFAALQARMKKLQKMFRPIIGYGYGRKTPRQATSVEKLAGQQFWALLTGEDDFYLRIASAMSHFAADHGAQYAKAFDRKHRQLARQFLLSFVTEAGDIDWHRLIEFNSGATRPKPLRITKPAQ